MLVGGFVHVGCSIVADCDQRVGQDQGGALARTAPPCWLSFQDNTIHTAKYNFFSFLPLNLYEQFHRMSNLYFLFIIILQVG